LRTFLLRESYDYSVAIAKRADFLGGFS